MLTNLIPQVASFDWPLSHQFLQSDVQVTFCNLLLLMVDLSSTKARPKLNSELPFAYWPIIEIWTQACYINLFGNSSRQLSHALRPPSDTNPRSSASIFALRADGWYKNAPVSRLSTQCRPSSCVAWSFCSRAWFPSRLITFGLMSLLQHINCPRRSI